MRPWSKGGEVGSQKVAQQVFGVCQCGVNYWDNLLYTMYSTVPFNISILFVMFGSPVEQKAIHFRSLWFPMVINSYLGAWLEYGGHHGVGDVVQVVCRVQAAPPCPLRVLVRLRNKNCVSLTSMCKKSIFLNCLSNKSSFLFHLRNKSNTLMQLRR